MFAGFTRGQLQNWQTDLSKRAGMATILAEMAGFWQLGVCLTSISAQLAAGVKPELLPLMEVSRGTRPGGDGMQTQGIRIRV